MGSIPRLSVLREYLFRFLQDDGANPCRHVLPHQLRRSVNAGALLQGDGDAQVFVLALAFGFRWSSALVSHALIVAKIFQKSQARSLTHRFKLSTINTDKKTPVSAGNAGRGITIRQLGQSATLTVILAERPQRRKDGRYGNERA